MGRGDGRFFEKSGATPARHRLTKVFATFGSQKLVFP
jgi:hypothetical protein